MRGTARCRSRPRYARGSPRRAAPRQPRCSAPCASSAPGGHDCERAKSFRGCQSAPIRSLYVDRPSGVARRIRAVVQLASEVARRSPVHRGAGIHAMTHLSNVLLRAVTESREWRQITGRDLLATLWELALWVPLSPSPGFLSTKSGGRYPFRFQSTQWRRRPVGRCLPLLVYPTTTLDEVEEGLGMDA